MSLFEVSKAAEEEWEDAMALAYRTFHKYVADGYSKEGVDNFENFISDPHLYQMFRLDEYHLWVAKDDFGNIIGMGTLRSGNHISLLFVEDKWLRKGVGSSIMEAFISHVRRTGNDRITVNASPYGVPFYHKLGFEDTGDEQVAGGMIITPMRKMI